MRIMVTGSRDWTDVARIRAALAEIEAEQVELIHGDQRGADRIAASLARYAFRWNVTDYPADWSRFGLSAGPIRNARMVKTKPNLVIAFPLPSSKGTWDAVERAEAAGIVVWIPYGRNGDEPMDEPRP